MACIIPFLSKDAIEARASPGSNAKALAELRGHVRLLNSGCNIVTAFVRAAGNVFTYHVAVAWAARALRLECTCPDRRGGFCKHGCAVLYQLLHVDKVVYHRGV